ncbi:Synaptobrevin [Hexamita inflata]|uniref:Synaptobrevin n=1 Tax=Hexamita inflata TaxID=28002 RepID=A0AA86NZZ8_9EUKA|nr:Synaptobrevin [Hexamita inflata]
MTVIYSGIAYKQTPLAHYGTLKEHLSLNVKQIEQELSKQPVQQNNHSFHTVDTDGYLIFFKELTVYAICEKQISNVAAYQMLIDIYTTFTKKYNLNTIQQAKNLQMNNQFESILKKKMKSIGKYLKQQSNLTNLVNDVKITVQQNCQQVMDKRNQQAASIENNAADLTDRAQEMKVDTDTLKYKIRLLKIMKIACICVVTTVIVLIIVLPIVL